MTADKNRIFLEDIGEIVMSRGGKDIWLVKGITQHETFQDRCLPEKIYVVDFPGRGLGEELLLSRKLFYSLKGMSHQAYYEGFDRTCRTVFSYGNILRRNLKYRNSLKEYLYGNFVWRQCDRQLGRRSLTR